MKYYYLVSTLPMLTWGMDNSPMTAQEFVTLCTTHLPESDLKLIESISIVPKSGLDEQDTAVSQFMRWETVLRNLIAVARGGNQAEKYLRTERDSFADLAPLIQQATSASDMLARERLIDYARWQKLDSLESLHPFDLQKLAMYKLKLMILDKYRGRDSVRGAEAFDELVGFVAGRKPGMEDENNK